MKKDTENYKNQNFLKEDFKGSIYKQHSKYLGAKVPKDYFARSKHIILDKIKEEVKIEEQTIKQIVFYKQPKFKYFAAASLVFIFSLTLWLQNANNNLEDNNLELLSYQDEVLINSLLVDDAEMDLFVEKTLINEIVIQAELSEQRMDNLILDVMVLEDSLLEHKFIESLIL